METNQPRSGNSEGFFTSEIASYRRLLFTDRNPLKEKLLDAALAVSIGLGLALLGLEYFGILTQ